MYTNIKHKKVTATTTTTTITATTKQHKGTKKETDNKNKQKRSVRQPVCTKRQMFFQATLERQENQPSVIER